MIMYYDVFYGFIALTVLILIIMLFFMFCSLAKGLNENTRRTFKAIAFGLSFLLVFFGARTAVYTVFTLLGKTTYYDTDSIVTSIIMGLIITVSYCFYVALRRAS